MARLRLEDCPPEIQAQLLRKLKEQEPLVQKITVYAMAYRVGSRWFATGFNPNKRTMTLAVQKQCVITAKAAAETVAGNPPARLVTATIEKELTP
ncbi:hypothetical protein UFOVP1254_42 [uncultured Caudovirales phage]|uniref:Uncharacterized protein n=1 Tax=uncultured Caudovirales phage TaxID=2100421 RepID=A0A6J5REK9_9CAUD|nr:hypothetical protein UFOVP1254_42 [uncultured Caudovirales phage]